MVSVWPDVRVKEKGGSPPPVDHPGLVALSKSKVPLPGGMCGGDGGDGGDDGGEGGEGGNGGDGGDGGGALPHLTVTSSTAASPK